MSRDDTCLGAILLLVIAFIFYFAWARRARRRPGQGFLSGGQVLYDEVAPAPPQAQKAAKGLYAELGRVVALGDRFAEVASEAGGPAPPAELDPASRADPTGAGWMLGARQGVARLTETLRRAEGALSRAPPTWRGYNAVYRGLASSDGSLLCASRAYTAGGHQVHQMLAAAQLGRDAPAPPPLLPNSPYLIPSADSSLAEAGAILVAVGDQLRAVVRAVHSLGVALDLE